MNDANQMKMEYFPRQALSKLPLRTLVMFGIFTLVTGMPVRLFAELSLPAIFSDHMVLQAGRETAIWGWADADSVVDVAFVSDEGKEVAKVQVKADASGRWMGHLPKVVTGSAGTISIKTGDGAEKTISDVLVGEVWLGSGQSNMDFTVGAYNVPKPMQNEQMAYADTITPQIRLFKVKGSGADVPLDDVEGEWLVTTSENVRHFPAVAWYFARTLQKNLDSPVGMIVSAVGGTPVSAWLPREALDETPASQAIWQRHEKALDGYQERLAAYNEALAKWKETYPTSQLQQKFRASAPKEPYSPTHKVVPTRLYNGKLHGISPYTISGFLWYQGEQDANHSGEYPELVRKLVHVLRTDWKEELPFYYVELAAYMDPQKEPVEDGWALIREAQSGVLELPKTGVASAIDLGMAEDVHPPYKDVLGGRLARLVLNEVYGKNINGSRSPAFEGFQVEGNKVRIRFRDAEGLRSKNETAASGFAIREEGGEWKWGDFLIENDEVIVWNDAVEKPVAVRYGWASNPFLSVENGEGLPVRPFRTDKK